MSQACSLTPCLLSAGALPLLIKRLAHGDDSVRVAALGFLGELAELALPIAGDPSLLSPLEPEPTPHHMHIVGRSCIFSPVLCHVCLMAL